MKPVRFGIALRLGAALTMATTATLAVYGGMAVKREHDLFERTKKQFGEVLGYELAARIAERWKRQGPQAAAEVLGTVDSRGKDVQTRWVYQNAPQGSGHYADLTAEQWTTLARQQHLSWRKAATSAEELYRTYVPIPVDDPSAGAVEVVESLADRSTYVQHSSLRLILAGLALVLVNAIVALALSSWFVGRPVGKLMNKLEQVGRGEFSLDVDLKRNDEIGRLAAGMNEMSSHLAQSQQRAQAQESARIAAEQGLRHAERLATVGKLAAGVAHEIGTPLNVISGRAKSIWRNSNDDNIKNGASSIREQTQRITQIVRHLLDFARRHGEKQASTDLPRLANQTVELLRATAKKPDNLTVRVVAGEGALTASVDPTQVQQVLTNLVMNAMQATPDGGEVLVRVDNKEVTPPSSVAKPTGEYICLSVEDHGVGIEPDNLAHIFEPFFTTKDVGEGTGLGLSVAYGIAQDHGGWIEVDSALGKGSTFSLFLPKAVS